MVNGAGLPVGTPLGDPALIEMISEDPVLRNTKLIAEAWDCDGLNQIGAFPHYGGRWSEWNGQFRDVVRQFIKVSIEFFSSRASTKACSHNTVYEKFILGEHVCCPYVSVSSQKKSQKNTVPLLVA